MKKLTLFILLISVSISSFSQETAIETEQKKYEVKINSISLIGFSWLDISYEYLINNESSFGIAGLISFNNDESLDTYKTYSITPYYRRYFSKKYAQGFFIEGFGMLNGYKENKYLYYDYIGLPLSQHPRKTATNFALGVTAGAKFVSPNGFVVEFYFGIGRNLFRNFDYGLNDRIVGRGGVSLGYRF